MALAPNISLVTVTGEYVDYTGNPIAGQIEFRLPKTLLNALADQIVVQSSYAATLDAFGQFSITIPATDDPNFNETFQYTIIERFSGGREWQASLPGVDSFEDLQSRYVTFTGLTGSGQTFTQLLGVSSVKIADLVPAYTGGAFSELASYQAYVYEEQAVTTQEGYVSYSPAGVVLSSSYGNVAFVYPSYASVLADRASYALLVSTPVVAETGDILPLDDVRVNLITNPSFETNTTGWSAVTGNCTFTRSTSDSRFGSSCANLVFNTSSVAGDGIQTLVPRVSVTSGFPYTFSAYLKVDSGATYSYDVVIAWLNAAGADISYSATAANVTAGSGWNRISASGTAPVLAVSARFAVRRLTGMGTASTLKVDGIMFEQSSTVGAYFDGSFGGFWTGTAHASTSRNATVPSYALVAEGWADLAIEQAEELFPHPFTFTGSLGVQR